LQTIHIHIHIHTSCPHLGHIIAFTMARLSLIVKKPKHRLLKRKHKKSTHTMMNDFRDHVESMAMLTIPLNWMNKQTPDTKRPPRYPASSLRKCISANMSDACVVNMPEEPMTSTIVLDFCNPQ